MGPWRIVPAGSVGIETGTVCCSVTVTAKVGTWNGFRYRNRRYGLFFQCLFKMVIFNEIKSLHNYERNIYQIQFQEQIIIISIYLKNMFSTLGKSESVISSMVAVVSGFSKLGRSWSKEGSLASKFTVIRLKLEVLGRK